MYLFLVEVSFKHLKSKIIISLINDEDPLLYTTAKIQKYLFLVFICQLNHSALYCLICCCSSWVIKLPVLPLRINFYFKYVIVDDEKKNN